MLDGTPTSRPLLRGLPAWTWAVIGLLLGLSTTAAVQFLERHNLQAEADLRLIGSGEGASGVFDNDFAAR